MSYPVSGLVREFRADGYPDAPMVPHGMAVVLNAPAVFRFTAEACPERHLEAAALLGADVRGAGPGDAGRLLADTIIGFMRATGMPNGLAGVGYTEADIAALARGAFPQHRVLKNAPREISLGDLEALYRDALRYWA
jgi:alcohol dehydrogenase class IV